MNKKLFSVWGIISLLILPSVVSAQRFAEVEIRRLSAGAVLKATVDINISIS